MKTIAAEVAKFTHEQKMEFMEAGSITVCGVELTTADLIAKRSFKGSG
jgi:hypothetical protein